MSDQHDPDATVVDQVPVDAGTGAGGGPGEVPPGGGPPDDPGAGAGDGDGDGEAWYRTPAGMAGIGVAVVLVGVLLGWLIFGGDDDGEDASSTSTTTSTTTTSTTAAGAEPATPVTPAPATPPPASDQAQMRVDAARSRWQGSSGRSYVFSYFLNAEGLSGRLCVSGVAGDPGSVTDGTGPCGDDVESGGMGIEAWFDSIQDAINNGILVSASYDSTDGHPTEATIQPPEVDGAQMTQDFFQYDD